MATERNGEAQGAFGFGLGPWLLAGVERVGLLDGDRTGALLVAGTGASW